MEIDKETNTLLQEIADKLGTNIEHLWGVLIKQAYIDATTSMVFALACTALWVWFFKTYKKKTVVPEPKDEYDTPRGEWYGDLKAGMTALLAITGVTTLLILGCAVTTLITVLLNPEYWAIHSIIHHS